MEAALLIELVGGFFFVALGGILSLLPALGVKDFGRLADRIDSFGAVIQRFVKHMLRKVLPPAVFVGIVMGLFLPTVWMILTTATGVKLPGIRYSRFLVQRYLESVPPSNVWDWVILIASSGWTSIIGIVLSAAYFLLLKTLTENKVGNICKGGTIIAIIVLSPVALPLILYLLTMIVVMVLLLTVLPAVGIASSVGLLAAISSPMHLVSHVAHYLGRHNIERIAAICSVMCWLVSAFLFYCSQN